MHVRESKLGYHRDAVGSETEQLAADVAFSADANIPESERAAAHVEELLSRLDHTADLTLRARILLEVAKALRDTLGDRGQALDAIVEAWRFDPLNEEVLDVLEPLVRSEDRWTEVLEQTGTLAVSDARSDRALAYHEAMVRWLTSDVPNQDLARQWVERVRRIDPTHALVHVLQAAVSREHGDLKRELDELDLAVLSTRRKDERVRLHLLLASRYLEERTLNRALARKQYEQAHRLAPRAMAPLRGLEQLAVHERDSVALADVLRRQAETDVAAGERIEVLLRLAKILEGDFRRPELAARTLELAVEALQAQSGGADSAQYDVVLDELERCYRAARMWPELLAVLERAAITDADADKRGARLRRLGEVLESKLGDIRAALTTYQRIAGLMPDDETVVGELARLAEKASEVTLAVNCRERLAELSRDPIASARHNVVAGQLMMPIDAAEARRYFERAVTSDPTNSVAWNALVWDARANADGERLGRYLERRARACDVPRVQAAFFVELAEHRRRTGDDVDARNAYLEAITADPANESAASALLVPFVDEGRFREAEPLVEIVVVAAERDRDVTRLFGARRAQTAIAFALGKADVALRAALAAFDLRPEDEARADLVRAASDLRADPQVLTARAALVSVAELPDGLDLDTRVTLAEVLALIGESDRAVVLFEDALAERPEHERAIVGLAQQHALTGNKAAALRLKRQLALGVADPEARLAMLLEVGDALAKIDEDELAADVYEAARPLAPSDIGLLHKLLGVYQRSRRWPNVYLVLGAIVEVDTDAHRRAKTLFAMGQIASRELLDRGTALTMFDRALDVDPSRLEAFERIVRLLEDVGDWSGLEQMYRKMIARAEATSELDLAALLGKQLAVLCRDRIGDTQLAAAALRAVIHRRPTDEEAQEQLSHLLERSGQASGAVAVTLDRVLRAPLDPRPYPALFDLLSGQRKSDRAYAVASVMHFLDAWHAPADALHSRHVHPPLDSGPVALGAEGYRRLLHPALDPTLTDIFEIVTPALIDVFLSRMSFRSRMRHPGPNLRGHEALARSVTTAAKVFGVADPKLALRTTPGPVLGIAATKAPGMLVYPPGLVDLEPGPLAFKIGKRVMELSPPLLARALCPSVSELKALASSAARIATGQIESGDVALKERLKKDELGRLAEAVSASMGKGGRLDVHRWSELADLSASYGGLLLAGDVEAARVALASDPQAPGDLSPRDRMRELVAWFLGDTSADLRRSIGVALG